MVSLYISLPVTSVSSVLSVLSVEVVSSLSVSVVVSLEVFPVVPPVESFFAFNFTGSFFLTSWVYPVIE